VYEYTAFLVVASLYRVTDGSVWPCDVGTRMVNPHPHSYIGWCRDRYPLPIFWCSISSRSYKNSTPVVLYLMNLSETDRAVILRYLRLFSDLDSVTGCWNSQLYVHPTGYPQAVFHGVRRGAHRWVLASSLGYLPPPSVFACHKCDNKRCCNPDHIYLGNAKTNVRDMIERGQLKKGAIGRDNQSSFRRDRATYELARFLRLQGCRLKDVVEWTGVSQSHVSQLANGKASLPDW